jgi:hypothetical protein
LKAQISIFYFFELAGIKKKYLPVLNRFLFRFLHFFNKKS